MMKTLRLSTLSWLRRLGLAASSVLVVMAGFALASLFFTVLLIAGLAVGGWLWWHFRRLARQAHAAKPDFIEGEYTVEPTGRALDHQEASTSDRLSTTPPRHRS